jgi:hypothetical protein
VPYRFELNPTRQADDNRKFTRRPVHSPDARPRGTDYWGACPWPGARDRWPVRCELHQPQLSGVHHHEVQVAAEGTRALMGYVQVAVTNHGSVTAASKTTGVAALVRRREPRLP